MTLRDKIHGLLGGDSLFNGGTLCSTGAFSNCCVLFAIPQQRELRVDDTFHEFIDGAVLSIVLVTLTSICSM